MATSVLVRDETSLGEQTNELTLEFLTERITVRELIRGRIYQEVTEYNARQPIAFRGLIVPTDAERTLNGYQLRERRKIDWEAQYARALKAFAANGFILLIDDRQMESLDTAIELRHDTRVTFLRLVPLVGG